MWGTTLSPCDENLPATEYGRKYASEFAQFPQIWWLSPFLR